MQISNLVFFFLFLLRKITMAASSSSTASLSTAGVSFDELRLGTTKDYSFNVINLKKKNFQERVDSLIQCIKDTITVLEWHSSRKVEKFTIGKTFAPARANKKFDPKNKDTWRADGISKCWHTDYIKKGYDGLVIVGAASRKMLTDTSYRDTDSEEARMCNTEVWDQQSYALALESALISALIFHYAFKTFDPRLANNSFYPGKKKKQRKIKKTRLQRVGLFTLLSSTNKQVRTHRKLETFEGSNAHQKWIIFNFLTLP